MSGPAPSHNESRLLELLADRALCGLTESEQRELEALCQEHLASPTCPLEFCELDAAAAEVAVACSGSDCPAPPASVQARLSRAADAWCKDHCSVVGRIEPGSAGVKRSSGALAYLGWLAAAACLAIAVWVSRAPTPPSVGERYAAFKTAAKDAVSAPWGPFNSLDGKNEPPEQSGVTGEVVWSESKQTGFITFKGLKPNNPSAEQYQLWIIDKRGINQRISGALFDAKPDPRTGEVVVAIEPRIAVDNAAIFALTIEKPGGTWVSDTKRRVVLAQVKGG